MSWLHIARIPGTDGAGAWLVVPGIDDRVFSWAMATVRAPVPIKSLPTFHGWLVPMAAENALWSVIAQTYGTGVVCPECFHGELPCEAWINLVTNRFEAAHAEAMSKYQALPAHGTRGASKVEYDNYGNQRNNAEYGNGYGSGSYGNGPFDQWPSSPSQNSRRGYSRPTYDSYEAPKRKKTYDAPPKPPEPTRAERLSSAAKTLGVTWPASKEEIKKAFKRAALKSHPDMGGSDQAFIQVKQARDLLVAAV